MQVNNAIRECFESEMLLKGHSKAELERRNSGKYCLASMNDKFEGFVLGRETLDAKFETWKSSVCGIETEVCDLDDVREFLRAQGVRV